MRNLSLYAIALRILEDGVATKITYFQKGRATGLDCQMLWSIHRRALAALTYAANQKEALGIPGSAGIERTVVPYRPGWADDYAQEKQRLQDIFGDALQTVHHIGSTALPGLASKPVVDLALIFRTEAPEQDEAILLQKMTAAGYRYLGDRKSIGGRYFERYSPEGLGRTHAVQVQPHDSPHLARALTFLDMLRNDPAGFDEYSRIKTFLGQRFARQRGAYLWYKALWIREYLLRPATPLTWGASWVHAHAPPLYKMVARGIIKGVTGGRYGRHPLAQ